MISKVFFLRKSIKQVLKYALILLLFLSNCGGLLGQNKSENIIAKLDGWYDSIQNFDMQRLEQLKADCQAIAHSKEISLHDSIRAQAQNLQANALLYLKDTFSALQIYKQVLFTRSRIFGQKSDLVANVLMNIGHVYTDKERHDSAYIYYSQARKIKEYIWSKRTNQSGLIQIYTSLGKNLLIQQKFDSAFYYTQKALYINESVSIPNAHLSEHYIILSTIADIYKTRNKADSAIFFYKKALIYGEQQNIPSSELAYLYMDIGNTFRQKGDIDSALIYLNNAQIYYRQNEEELPKANFITLLYSQADCLRQLGSYFDAQEILGLIYDYIKYDSAAQADWFIEKGKILFYIGHIDEAIRCFWTTITLSEGMINRQIKSERRAIAYDYLGRIALEKEQFKEAIQHLKMAIEQSLWADNKSSTTVVWQALSKVYLEIRQFNNAKNALNKAKQLAKSEKDYRLLASIFLQEAEIYSEEQKFDIALSSIEASENALITAEETPSVSSTFLYEKGLIATAKAHTIYRKALTKQLVTDWQQVLLAVENAVVQLRNVRIKIDERRAGTEIQATFNSVFDMGVEAAWRLMDTERAFMIAEQAKQNVLKQLIIKAVPDKAVNLSNEALSSMEVSNGLGNEQTMLSFHWSNKHLFIFVLTKNQPLQLYEQPITDSLKKNIYKFYKLCSISPEDKNIPDNERDIRKLELISIGKNLYNLLFSKSVEISFKRELLIIPHNLLCYLPFEALIRPDKTIGNEMSDQDFLLKKQQVSYSYSTTLWRVGHDLPPRDAPKNVLAIAPTFDSNNALNERFDALEYNQKEAQKVVDRVGGQCFLAKEGTRSAFLTRLADYKILHLATHGVYDPLDSENSRIAFADGEILRGGEIYKITNLKADMVVLSACQTAIGEVRGGEGLMSLARGFQFASARTVMASLWNVVDATSVELMDNLYENLGANETKAAALTHAKQSFFAKGQFTHPYYWSGFLLIGDERAILLTSKWTKWCFLTTIVLLTLIGAVLLWLQFTKYKSNETHGY